MTNIIYTPDTDQFRLSDEQIFGKAPLPFKLQDILVELGFDRLEVQRTLVKGISVVPANVVASLRANYQKLKEFPMRLPAKVGIVTYSNWFKSKALADFSHEEPYEGIPEKIKLHYLPAEEFYPSFYAVNLGETTIRPKNVREALSWLGLDLPEEHKVPKELEQAILQMKDDTFGETEKLWNFEEFMDTITPENRIIITDIYIHDALPETKKFKYAVSGFRS